MRTVLVMGLCLAATASSAQSLDSLMLAQGLGEVLASEEMCDLKYNHDRIVEFIESNSPAGDMSFTSNLQMMTMGAKRDANNLSKSALVAHCAAIKKTALHYGFIDG